jgi:hypothetical protein
MLDSFYIGLNIYITPKTTQHTKLLLKINPINLHVGKDMAA